MSEQEKPKKKYGIPKYYRKIWVKDALYSSTSANSDSSKLSSSFVNKQQKQLYLFMTIFRVGIILAAIVMALMIVGLI
jgi:hypothetical protein